MIFGSDPTPKPNPSIGVVRIAGQDVAVLRRWIEAIRARPAYINTDTPE